MIRFKKSELKKTEREYWILESIKLGLPTDDNPILYQGYKICIGGYIGRWKFVHEDYDGAPDARDNRIGYGTSIGECIQQINEYILENEVES